MKTGRAIYLLLSSVSLTIFLTSTALALTGGRYLSEAKVTLTSARQIALKAFPGKIVSEELERESGGSGLRYSFVIQQEKVKHEVGVDAKSGQVLENSVEGKNPDWRSAGNWSQITVDDVASLPVKMTASWFGAEAAITRWSVIYTHTHPDHISGAAAFTDHTACDWVMDQN